MGEHRQRRSPLMRSVLKHRALIGMPPQPQSHRPDQQANKERYPEPPVVQRLCRHQHARGPRNTAAGQIAHHLAGELEAGHEAAPAAPVLQHERRRPAELPAGGKPLHYPCEKYAQRRQHPDRAVARHDRNHGGAERHQNNGQRHRRPAPRPVGVAPQHHCPERPGQKRRAVCSPGIKQRAGVRVRREERVTELRHEIAE